MKTLVLLLHAGEAVRHIYESALGSNCELLLHVSGSGSSAYQQLAAELRSGGSRQSLLERLTLRLGGLPLDRYGHVVVASWSAGYAMVRELLSEQQSVEQLSGVVSLDSWYASTEADGTANDTQLAGLVRLAILAKNGEKVLRLGATDVPTHGYSSTRSVMRELQRLAALTPMPARLPSGKLERVDGLCSVTSYDVKRSAHDEHVAALREWGCRELRLAVEQAQGLKLNGAQNLESCEGLADRSLAVLRGELGQREVAGAAHNPRIVEYLTGLERRGVELNFRADETHWCAALQSWVLKEARRSGDPWPHRPRVSVREIWEDAIAAGTARGAAAVRSGSYVVKPGDLLVGTRGGPAFGEGTAAFAKTRGLGHIGRAETPARGALIRGIDGNVGDMVKRTRWDVNAQTFVGAVCIPNGALETCEPSGGELEGLTMLDIAAIDRELWLHGDPPIERILAAVSGW